MFFSSFSHVANTLPDTHELSWTEFVDRFKIHLEISAKEQSPAISPAEWPSGARRAKLSVLRVHFAALDLDKISDESLATVLQALEPYRYFLHTTYSHAHTRASSNLNCLRVYLPLTRPLTMNEWPNFWNKLNALSGNVLDQACKDAGRVYFVPSMPPGTREQNYMRVHEGAELDPKSLTAANLPGVSSEYVTHSALKTFGEGLFYKTDNYKKEMGSLILRVVRGESFAGPGARDTTLFKICATLAERWPKANPKQLAAFFEASLRTMGAESDDAPTVDDVAEKIERKQQDAPQRANPVHGDDRLSHYILDAFKGERDYPYTEQELQRFAEQSGVTPSHFNTRWIIQKGDCCYLFVDGKYGSAIQMKQLFSAARVDLAPAITAGVECFRIKKSGALAPKNEKELLLEYSTLARILETDLASQETIYDWKTQTLIEAPCPMRPLVPEYNAAVDEYLRLLGGVHCEKLLDWVAVVTQLDSPCAALFLYGEPGAGKTLLANGLARIWHKGNPTTLTATMRDFNSSFLRCPLILADEHIPNLTKEDGGSAVLRCFIQETSRELRRKWIPDSELKGCARLVITANNEDVFRWREHLNDADIRALQERILAIHVDDKATRFLISLKGTTREFAHESDIIAKHALWLRDNRTLTRGHRFLVSGHESSFHHSLVSNNGMSSGVLNWVTSYLQDPVQMDQSNLLQVRVWQGRVLVTSKCLVENWDTYTTNIEPRFATSNILSKALRSLSEPKKKQLNDGVGKNRGYWVIQPEYLFHWNERSGFASEEEIKDALAKDTLVGKTTETKQDIFAGAGR